MKTIAVLALKGGSGKSTTLLNLAAYTEGCGKSSVVIDLDPMSASCEWYERRERSETPEVLFGSPIQAAPDAAPGPHPDRLGPVLDRHARPLRGHRRGGGGGKRTWS